MNDFTSTTKRALARQGIRVVGLTVIPATGNHPFAKGDRGYILDDNGCQRIRSFAQVMEAANG